MHEQLDRELAGLHLSGARKTAILETLKGEKPVGKKRRVWNTVWIAAALCVLLAVSAAAYSLGAFDFLKEQNEYALLGQSEVYEKYAYDVDRSVTAENGDVLTVDRLAIDGKFCTIFYSVQSVEPMKTLSEQSSSVSGKAPDLWQARRLAPMFSLCAGDELISMDDYSDGCAQQYLWNSNTLYGVVRLLLTRPLEEGEEFALQGRPSYAELLDSDVPASGDALKWSLSLTAHPIQSRRVVMNLPFTGEDEKSHQMEAVSLDLSPLGNVLLLRETIPANEDYGLWGSFQFALRDGDTGEYIPYGISADEWNRAEGISTTVYELYGDLSGLNTLEIVPVNRNLGTEEWIETELDALPVGQGNPDGGYVLTECSVEEDRIILTWRPDGATINVTQCVALVNFFDRDGNRLFHEEDAPDGYGETFINHSDGSVTAIVTGVDLPEGYLERAVRLSFWAERYDLLPENTITISLT